MPDDPAAQELRAIAEAFLAALAARGEGAEPRWFETHISLVLLAGAYAYKFKKAVDFGFVDFSTLARRRHFCAREVALNARFAPGLYLGVEAIRVPPSAQVVEYAVRMQRFDPADTLDQLIARGAVGPADIAEFAQALATTHAALPPLADSACGTARLSAQQIVASAAAPLAALLPDALQSQLAATIDSSATALAARHADGHVRACHGDLHLANVVRIDGHLMPFDCIEFDDQLSSIDTLSDAAFPLMDLDANGQPALGHVFFNRYFETSGDYAGLPLLMLYLAYRALVRGKVALLAAGSTSAAAREAERRARAKVALAGRYLAPAGRAGLLITHGLSGSGKTYHARQCAERWGYLHLRSDVERKRLAGLAADASSGSAAGGGLYTPAHNARTYDQLYEAATAALRGGFSVVVDATFLERRERARFAALAAAHAAPFHILACSAPLAELRQRVAARSARGDDPSEATLEVLERQLQADEAFAPDEQACALAPAALWALNAPTRVDLPCGRMRAH